MHVIDTIETDDLDAALRLLIGKARRDVVVVLQSGVNCRLFNVVAARGRINDGVDVALSAKDLFADRNVRSKADLLELTRLTEGVIRNGSDRSGHVVAFRTVGVKVNVKQRLTLVEQGARREDKVGVLLGNGDPLKLVAPLKRIGGDLCHLLVKVQKFHIDRAVKGPLDDLRHAVGHRVSDVAGQANIHLLAVHGKERAVRILIGGVVLRHFYDLKPRASIERRGLDIHDRGGNGETVDIGVTLKGVRLDADDLLAVDVFRNVDVGMTRLAVMILQTGDVKRLVIDVFRQEAGRHRVSVVTDQRIP